MPGNKLLQRVYMKITSEVGGMAERVKSIIALEVDNQPRLTSFDFFGGVIVWKRSLFHVSLQF